MFHGSIVAIVTPMNQQGDIDFERFRALLEWHIEQGTHAIVVAGTTGESGTMNRSEKLQLINTAVEQAKERLPIIAGTHANSTRDAIELAIEAEQAGADAALIMTPAYIKPTQEGLFQHYSAIAKAAAIPQIVYNVPGRTACDILPDTIARLDTIPNIVGVKEATGSIERAQEILKKAPKMDVYSGDDLTAQKLMAQGAKGVISVTANIAPALVKQMCEAALKGEHQQAASISESLMPLSQALFSESNPIPVKWALAHMQRIDSNIRLPLTQLSADKQPELKILLEQLK